MTILWRYRSILHPPRYLAGSYCYYPSLSGIPPYSEAGRSPSACEGTLQFQVLCHEREHLRFCDVPHGYPARRSSVKFQGMPPPSPAQGPAGRSGQVLPVLRAAAKHSLRCWPGRIVAQSTVQMVSHQMTGSSGVFPDGGSTPLHFRWYL